MSELLKLLLILLKLLKLLKLLLIVNIYIYILHNIMMKITRKENGVNANTNAEKEAF